MNIDPPPPVSRIAHPPLRVSPCYFQIPRICFSLCFPQTPVLLSTPPLCDASIGVLYDMGSRYSLDRLKVKLALRSVRDEAAGCLLWTGALHEGGYGRMWDGARLQYAHRVSYEVNHGPIPEGLDVLHNCPAGDNPRCIEGGHLWCGTHAENMADRDAKGRNGAWRNRGHDQPSKARGVAHPGAVLTEAQVLEIRERLKPPLGKRKPPNGAALAREYGVSESLIYGIRNGRNWGWLK